MKTKHIHALVAFGTRPEAIKLAPVISEFARRRKEFKLTVCATKQHRHLLDQVTTLFNIPVTHDLNIMRPNQALDELTANALLRVSPILEKTNPDVVIVQGDTTTAFATALAAFYLRIPVAHVEAGLRTGDRFAPFPEEINRRLTTHLVDYHFAPTDWARENLLREGIAPGRIFVTGNTVIDVFQKARRLVCQRPPLIPALKGLSSSNPKLILVTAHRRENFGRGIEAVCVALRQLAMTRADIEIVYPVHPNPNVRHTVWRMIGSVPRIHLIEPLGYLQFVSLMSKSYLALTDSGGIQEEMPSLDRPVLLMRDKTERPEGVRAGVCQLVGTRPKVICDAVIRLLDDKQAYRQFASKRNPFGDGRAAPRIANQLAKCLQHVSRKRDAKLFA